MKAKQSTIWFALSSDGEIPPENEFKLIGHLKSMTLGCDFVYFPMRNGIQKIVINKRADSLEQSSC